MDVASCIPLNEAVDGAMVLVPVQVRRTEAFAFVDVHIQGSGQGTARIFSPDQVTVYPIADDAPAAAAACSQCGQRTPVCSACEETIIFVPKSGFGMTGEWRHLAPPKSFVSGHQARPKVFIS